MPDNLEHIPLMFELSKPHFWNQHIKRGKKMKGKKEKERDHGWNHELREFGDYSESASSNIASVSGNTQLI